jgi:hypothetical protein
MMSTPEQKEKRLSLFIDSGIIDDKNWKKEKVKHRVRGCISRRDSLVTGQEGLVVYILYCSC